MKADQPDLLFCHYMNDLPVTSLCIQLLDRGAICKSFISNGVYIAFCEGTAIRSTDCLTQLRQCLLPFRGYVEAFTLSEIVSFQGTTDDKDIVFLLSDTEIYPIVHHLAQCLKLPLRDVKLDYLRAGNVGGPIKALRFIASNYQNILLVYNNDLTLAYFTIIHFERGPPQRLKVVKCMLIQLCKIE